MVAVMLHRYDKRRGGPSLFGAEDDQEPSRPISANSSVYEAARLHLLQKFDRPYYYGIADLCDASSENAEQFLQLATVLVETSATQIIRSKPAYLSAATQHKLLRQRGEQIIDGWSFPQHLLVRRLATEMAARCVKVTAQPNGWLTPNASASVRRSSTRSPMHTRNSRMCSSLASPITPSLWSRITRARGRSGASWSSAAWSS
jgi:hypothetical protein